MSSTRIAEAKGILFLLLIIALLAVGMMATTGKLEDWFGIRLFRPPDVAGKIVFVSDRNGHNDIWIMDRDGSHARALTNDRFDDHSPVWSPDGTEITFISDRDQGKYELYAVSYNGKRIRKVSTSSGTKDGQVFSPDGKEIAFLNSGKVNVRNIAERHEHQVLPGEEDTQAVLRQESNISFSQVDWCRGGNMLAAVQRLDPMEGVCLLDMDSNKYGIVKSQKGAPVIGEKCQVAWSRSGQKLAIASYKGPNGNTLDVMDLDSQAFYPLTGISAPKLTLTQPEWSADDSSIVSVMASVDKDGGFQPKGLVITESSEGKTQVLEKGECDHPKWSPDGREIVYAKKQDVCVIDPDTGESKNLTGGKGRNFDPSWAPGVKDN